VDRFAEAARVFMGRDPEALPWWTKIEKPGVMDLIRPAAVIESLDRFMQGAPSAREQKAPTG
jgi:heptosyltransferase I